MFCGRGVPVFTVPGVYVMLPSPRGAVRFTPLFLNKQHVDATAAFVWDAFIHSVRRSQPLAHSTLLINA
jgi:hypothetical protein